MPYTADDRPLRRSSEELRAQIPGWGADLDPADRPSYPKLRRDLETGAHWDFPERQPERTPPGALDRAPPPGLCQGLWTGPR